MTVTLADLQDMAKSYGLPDADMQRKLGTASALVERYAPGAPDAVKDEATIRVVGWLAERYYALSAEEIGETEFRQSPSGVNALYHSGASGLLAPWRQHGLGAVSA